MNIGVISTNVLPDHIISNNNNNTHPIITDVADVNDDNRHHRTRTARDVILSSSSSIKKQQQEKQRESLTILVEKMKSPSQQLHSTVSSTTGSTADSSTSDDVHAPITITTTTTSTKLQQLKSSLREQRRRHATILCGGGGSSSRNITTGTTTNNNNHQPPPLELVTKKRSGTVTTPSGEHCNVRIIKPVDRTTSNSSVANTSCCGGDDGNTTVTTTQSTMISSTTGSSCVSGDGSNRQQQQQQQQRHSADVVVRSLNCISRSRNHLYPTTTTTTTTTVHQQPDVTVSPLSCGLVTPTHNQSSSNHSYNYRTDDIQQEQYQQHHVHLNKSIHVPNLAIESLCDYADGTTSPGHSSFDDDEDDNNGDNKGNHTDNDAEEDQQSTTSSTTTSDDNSIKPPTLEEIYAAMGEILETKNPSTPISLQLPQTIELPLVKINNANSNDKINNSNESIESHITDRWLCDSSVLRTPVRTLPSGTKTNSTTSRILPLKLPETGRRSPYIAQMYENHQPTSPSHRPTMGLRRLEQRLQQQQQSIDAISSNMIREPMDRAGMIQNMSIVLNEDESINHDVSSQSPSSTLPLSTSSSSSNSNQEGVVRCHYDDTSLSDDVLDVLSAPTTPLSIHTTSSATLLSCSDYILESDDDDDKDNDDYTSNSDTSGWASMGDSTAGPLGCESFTDQMSAGSFTCPTYEIKPMLPCMNNDKAVQCTDPVILPKTALSSQTKRKDNPKKKNTVTFQIETIEMNITTSSKQQPELKRESQALPQPTITKNLLPSNTECPDSGSLSNNTIKPLFVSSRRADELCVTNGGHFTIALQCGMTLWQLSDGLDECIPLIPLPIVPTAPSFVRLSTDFRCGTYGSLYDIATRSRSTDDNNNINQPSSSAIGSTTVRRPSLTDSTNRSKNCIRARNTGKRIIRSTTVTRTKNTKEPQQQHPTIQRGEIPPRLTKPNKSITSKTTTKTTALPYIPVRGGIYDTALQSGLTKESLRSRTPYSITIKPSSSIRRNNNDMVVPERISDHRCGVRTVMQYSVNR